MSRRYSRQEKGKWTASSDRQPRRAPVVIPPSDNEDLIEENRLTLIGRVTNPAIQKPQWVIDWLIQYWNLESRVTGRDLGPDLFQLRFETEEALQSVLRKAPYHYKRWMLILQRWEPIISDSFPSMLPFWIKIHGIPLHFWNDQTVTPIGKALGPILDKEPTKRRVRVHINGLRPLEMQLPVQLPGGEVITVNLEYEKLEKHCFICFSLSHEKDDCPANHNKDRNAPAQLNISQENTLRRLEESRRRRHDHRRGQQVSSGSLAPPPRDRYHSRRNYEAERITHRSSASHAPHARYTNSHHGASNDAPSRDSYHRGSGRHTPNQEDRPLVARSQGSHHTMVNRSPPSSQNRRDLRDSLPLREPSPVLPASSQDLNPRHQRTPTTTQAHPIPAPVLEVAEITSNSRERTSALARLERPVEDNQRSAGLSSSLQARLQGAEIPPAIEQRPGGLSSSLIARLQDVDVQYEVTAEDARVVRSSATKKKSTPAAKKTVAPTQTAKRRTTTQNKRAAPARANRSPLQGTRTRKQNTIRTSNPPRKRLCLDKGGPSATLPRIEDPSPPAMIPVPATQKGRVDFRDGKNPLP